MDSPHVYIPLGVQNSRAGSTVSESVMAGGRAQARHSAAFYPSRHLDFCLESKGLHSWDVALRASEEPAVRDQFIDDSRNDLHDAVSDYSSS